MGERQHGAFFLSKILFCGLAKFFFAMDNPMMLAPAKPVPSVEIAPSVLMPMLSFGITMQHSLFLALGGRGLDTAFDYGDKYQAELGRAVATSGLPRSAVFVTTKVPCCASSFVKDDVYSNHCHARRSPEETAADVAHDLSVLGMPFVDLLLMHWPCDSTADTVATWRVLERLALDGRARAIGVSNFNASAIESLLPHVKVQHKLRSSHTHTHTHTAHPRAPGLAL